MSSPTTSRRSSPRVVILSPPPLSARLSVTSRRSFAMLPLTSSKRWPLPLPPPPSRSPMSFPTVKSSPSVTSVSVPRGPLPTFLLGNGILRNPRDHLQLHHEVRC